MNTETKFTPGPWEINSQKNLILALSGNRNKWIACMSAVELENITEEERLANLKLIATAPDHFANAQYIEGITADIVPDLDQMDDDEVIQIQVTAKYLKDNLALIKKLTN